MGYFGRALPDSRVIANTYDANGNISSITPSGKLSHGFQLNGMEFLSTYAPPAFDIIPGPSKPTTGQAPRSIARDAPKDTTYSYNLDKQLTLVSRPDGKSIVYSHDLTTGLLSKITTDVGDYVFTYVNGDQIQKVESPYINLDNRFTYKGELMTSNELFVDGIDSLGKVEFEFNNDFLPTSKKVRGYHVGFMSSADITRNDDGLPVTYGNMTLEYSYPSGRLSGTELGVTEDEITYDSYGNLETYKAYANSAVIYSYDLTRDSMSRIIGVSETINGVTSAYEYFYDTSGRLTSVEKNSTVIASFTYDSNGNRTSTTIDGGTYTGVYDDQDRMTSYGGTTYLYNNNGDTIQSQTALGFTKTYSYDAMGNINAATVAGKSYVYFADGLNRKTVVKDVAADNGAIYLYEDQLRIAGQLDHEGVFKKAFFYPTDSHSPDYMVENDITYRIIKNHLGSPRLVVKVSDGTIKQQIDYNVLGRVTKDTNSCFVPFGFAGGLRDKYTSLVRFGAREYDTETGRWTTKDPIRFDGGDTNLYAYVGNDPVNAIDPTGLKTVIRQFSNNAGHVSISVDNSPFLGFYPSGNVLYSTGVVRNDSLRTDVVRDVVINTTPEQERIILRELLNNAGKPYSIFAPNCATRASDVLEAAGINSINASPVPAIYVNGGFFQK